MSVLLIEALKPVVSQCGTRRVLDYCYGPQAKALRAQVASVLYGEPIKASDKRCQWGNWRKKLLQVAEITGSCIAVEDSNFQEKVAILFPAS